MIGPRPGGKTVRHNPVAANYLTFQRLGHASTTKLLGLTERFSFKLPSEPAASHSSMNSSRLPCYYTQLDKFRPLIGL